MRDVVFAPFDLQKSVQGLGLSGAKLHHPFGGPPGGGGKQIFKLMLLHYGNYRTQGGGFSCARAARKYKYAVFKGLIYSFSLIRFVGYAVYAFNGVYLAVDRKRKQGIVSG